MIISRIIVFVTNFVTITTPIGRCTFLPYSIIAKKENLVLVVPTFSQKINTSFNRTTSRIAGKLSWSKPSGKFLLITLESKNRSSDKLQNRSVKRNIIKHFKQRLKSLLVHELVLKSSQAEDFHSDLMMNAQAENNKINLLRIVSIADSDLIPNSQIYDLKSKRC